MDDYQRGYADALEAAAKQCDSCRRLVLAYAENPRPGATAAEWREWAWAYLDAAKHIREMPVPGAHQATFTATWNDAWFKPAPE